MKIFEPLYDVVSWIILTLQTGFDKVGMNASFSWCLAIVGLVVIIRILLIPLFVKQIKSMRAMQQLQPEIKKIQKRYKGDRERTSQELMALYKKHNTNPLSSCMPILAQAPIFFALYQVLNNLSKEPPRPKGVLDQEDVNSAAEASFFGIGLGDKFIGAEDFQVQFITVIMILGMSASQFFTQKQLMSKNMPAAALEASPFLQQQKIMMYLFPVIFAVVGINFPVGVLLYWLVSNLWSMGQQMYVIRRMPVVGSKAHDAMVERQERKAAKRGLRAGPQQTEDDEAAEETVPAAPARKPRGPQPTVRDDSDGAPDSSKSGGGAKSGGGGKSGGGATGGPKKGKSAGGANARPAAGSKGVRHQPQRQSRSKRSGSKKR